jgi:hypothetical protein
MVTHDAARQSPAAPHLDLRRAGQEDRHHRPDPVPHVLSPARTRRDLVTRAALARTAVRRAAQAPPVPASPASRPHSVAGRAADRISRDVSDVTGARAVATAVADAGSSLLLLPSQGATGIRVTRRRHTAHRMAMHGFAICCRMPGHLRPPPRHACIRAERKSTLLFSTGPGRPALSERTGPIRTHRQRADSEHDPARRRARPAGHRAADLSAGTATSARRVPVGTWSRDQYVPGGHVT